MIESTSRPSSPQSSIPLYMGLHSIAHCVYLSLVLYYRDIILYFYRTASENLNISFVNIILITPYVLACTIIIKYINLSLSRLCYQYNRGLLESRTRCSSRHIFFRLTPTKFIKSVRPCVVRRASCVVRRASRSVLKEKLLIY